MFETLVFNPRAGINGILNQLYTYSNIPEKEQGFTNESILLPVTNDAETIRSVDSDTAINTECNFIKIRDRKIDLTKQQKELTIFELMRKLTVDNKDELMATNAELENELGQKIPKVKVFEEWHHPDIASGEKPSDIEFFNELTDAILTNKVKDLKAPHIKNTHWKHWPEGGNL